jgi:hypothetical protein
MEKVCDTCGVKKPLSEYRGNRKRCEKCQNKIRYGQNKLRRQVDSVFNEEWKARDVKRKRRKEKEDTMTGFIQKMRVCVRKSIKRGGYTKKSRTYEILGAEWDFVKSYLESMFKDGMTWENYGEWEIDHIIPISSGNTEDEVIKLCHYSNLQPLWKEENLLKGNKILV